MQREREEGKDREEKVDEGVDFERRGMRMGIRRWALRGLSRAWGIHTLSVSIQGRP